MKKVLALTMAAAMVTASLTACGGSEPAAKETEAKTEAAAPEAKEEAKETVAATGDWTPKQPITIMNYVKAGGGMDIATRKFAEIARKYTDATFVVDNTPGAGGMTAMEYVMSQPADGYTIFAGTVSNIAYLVANEEDLEKYVWGLEWIDDIMADPYSIMVPKDSDINTLEDLQKVCADGATVWCGPSTGGAKHLAGMQLWAGLGIENATWVPFESGPDALLAVIGGQGIATVGNPGDVDGKELKNIVIATEEKLPNFPDVQNFADCGFPEIDKMNMWRGFAVKQGTDPEMIAWFQNLVDQVTADEDWVKFFNDSSIVVFNKKTDEFHQIIENDIANYIDLLKSLEMIDEDYEG